MAPRNRDARYEEKRRQLVEAAGRVFAEKGFSGATNREIAAAAGISPGLIYWYFESKEDLFVAILEQLTPIRSGQIPPEVADALPVEEFLQRLAISFLTSTARPEVSAVFRLVMSEVLRFPEPAEQIGALLARHPISYLANYIERQSAAGRVRPIDPWLAAQAYLGSLVGYVVRKYVLRHADLQQVDDAAMAATTSRLFAAGLLVATESGAEAPVRRLATEEGGSHGDQVEHSEHTEHGHGGRR